MALRQDAKPASDLAHTDRAHHLPVFIVVRYPDQARYFAGRRNLRQAQSQAEPAQALGKPFPVLPGALSPFLMAAASAVRILYCHGVRSPLDQRSETRFPRDSERSTEQ